MAADPVVANQETNPVTRRRSPGNRQAAANLMGDLDGAPTDVHPDGVLGRLQDLELARQQLGVHEVPAASLQPLADQFLGSGQPDVMDDVEIVPQVLLVGMLERRAGKDQVFSTISCLVDQPGKCLEPGLAVLVGQRNPRRILSIFEAG